MKKRLMMGFVAGVTSLMLFGCSGSVQTSNTTDDVVATSTDAASESDTVEASKEGASDNVEPTDADESGTINTVDEGAMPSEETLSFDEEDFWGNMLIHYKGNASVDTLVFVKCYEDTNALVQVYEKDGNDFSMILQCPAYIGRNGYSMPGERFEGDGTVPCGDFGVVYAMGIKSAPETSMDYIQFTDDLYWSDNPDVCYNKLVSEYDYPDVTGEHLAGIFPEYNYVLALDFNPECVPGVGSAIFFHCMGEKTYTGGCVAVAEENMLEIMKHFDAKDRVIIFPINS